MQRHKIYSIFSFWNACLLCVLICLQGGEVKGLQPPASNGDPKRTNSELRRRDLLVELPLQASAVVLGTTSAARMAGATASANLPSQVLATQDSDASSLSPSVLLPRSNNVYMPRVGYSMYKTAPEQVVEGVGLALQAGVRQFDCGSQYRSNAQVGTVLKRYIQTGQIETRNGLTMSSAATTKAERRAELFVTHKVSNAEQSLSTKELQRNLMQQQVRQLGLDAVGRSSGNPKLDLVMIHSPLTDRNRRLSTYATLCDLKEQNKIGAVGVCHFGLAPLQELVEAGLPPPSVIQLELSPFHQHAEIAEWAKANKCLLSCSAWSRLSSKSGPVQGWDTLAQKVAQPHNMTKQQVLIRWAVQRGYLCTPRSNSQYKVDRQTIQENSWDATKELVLTKEDMVILDGLDERISAGQLGVLDGWESEDVWSQDPNSWDPTTTTT